MKLVRVNGKRLVSLAAIETVTFDDQGIKLVTVGGRPIRVEADFLVKAYEVLGFRPPKKPAEKSPEDPPPAE